MEPQLSGLELEYRIVLLYSRDRGRREAHIGASLGPGTEDIGFRNRAAVLFDVAPSRDVTVRVRDENGRPSMASFVVKTHSGACIRRDRSASRRTSFFRSRFIEQTARPSAFRPGNLRSRADEVPNTFLKRERYRSTSLLPRWTFDSGAGLILPPSGCVLGRPSHPCRWVLSLREPD